ncbi:MAG: hypothetical protein FDZ70_03565 [Actinobacteria bacterium]|nr:MAG: hypothetical protein FDZ70_03565 [Actinomycetota bacterium]
MGTTAATAFSEVAKVAPYVIAAYGLLWATMVVYVGMTMVRLGRLEREIEAVEEAVARRTAEA